MPANCIGSELTGWCRRFQQAHILGIPTIVRDLQPGFDWDADTMMRATRKQHQIKRGGRDVTLTVRCSMRMAGSGPALCGDFVWGLCPRRLLLHGPQGASPSMHSQTPVRPGLSCRASQALQHAAMPASTVSGAPSISAWLAIILQHHGPMILQAGQATSTMPSSSTSPMLSGSIHALLGLRADLCSCSEVYCRWWTARTGRSWRSR